MNSTTFDETNHTLTCPVDMTEDQCSSLEVYTDGTTCVSCWRLTLRERLSALFFGRCWLGVRSGTTHPPVWINCTRTMFVKPKKERRRIPDGKVSGDTRY